MRTSAAERQLDQQLLDSVPRGLARDAVEQRVQQIRVRRDKEIATGVPEDPGIAEPSAKRKRLRLRPQICNETIQISLLKGQHSRIVRESLAHEAMRCFRITGCTRSTRSCLQGTSMCAQAFATSGIRVGSTRACSVSCTLLHSERTFSAKKVGCALWTSP